MRCVRARRFVYVDSFCDCLKLWYYIKVGALHLYSTPGILLRSPCRSFLTRTLLMPKLLSLATPSRLVDTRTVSGTVGLVSDAVNAMVQPVTRKDSSVKNPPHCCVPDTATICLFQHGLPFKETEPYSLSLSERNHVTSPCHHMLMRVNTTTTRQVFFLCCKSVIARTSNPNQESILMKSSSTEYMAGGNSNVFVSSDPAPLTL